MTITIDGRKVALPADLVDAPLLDVLRDYLGLVGPRFGCGQGACGACTVHLDGAAARSCQLVAADCTGAAVTTLQALGRSSANGLHPIQAAWIAFSVPQCGYCQNGQIMTAAAAFDEAGATEDSVLAALETVICRCGTHTRIRAAVRAAFAKLRP